jgi:hypothetical protein
LAELKTLDSLELSAVCSGLGAVTTQGIQTLRTFPHLRRLVLLCRLPEGGLGALGSLHELQELELLGDYGKDESLVPLSEVPKLRRLTVTCATDEALASMKSLKSIEELCLRPGLWFTDAGVAKLRAMVSLRSLSLYAPNITAKGLSQLADLPRLEHLAFGWSATDVDACRFGPADLSSWRGLRSVDISCLRPEDGSAVRLPASLEALRLSQGEALALQPLPGHLRSVTVMLHQPDAVDLKWLSPLPDLRELCLQGRIDSAVKAIADLKALRALTLARGTEPVSDEGMKRIGELRQLESLEIEEVGSEVTDAGMASLRNLGELRRLNLKAMNKVTDEGFACLRDLKRLRALSLDLSLRSQPRNFDGMLSHVQALGELEELSIQGAALTDEGLKKLADLKKLRRLDLTGCDGYTDNGLRALMQALPNLQEVKRSYLPVD